jgi:hypothetical protein
MKQGAIFRRTTITHGNMIAQHRNAISTGMSGSAAAFIVILKFIC